MRAGMEATARPQPTSDRTFFVFNAVVSLSAVAFLFYILVIRRGTAGTGLDLRFMPAVNASLNALSACLLITGWVAIRRKAVQLHRYCQVSAFASSSLFLIGYLAYHFVHGDTKFQGGGPIRALYLVILTSHSVPREEHGNLGLGRLARRDTQDKPGELLVWRVQGNVVQPYRSIW